MVSLQGSSVVLGKHVVSTQCKRLRESKLQRDFWTVLRLFVTPFQSLVTTNYLHMSPCRMSLMISARRLPRPPRQANSNAVFRRASPIALFEVANPNALFQNYAMLLRRRALLCGLLRRTMPQWLSLR